MGSSLSWIAVRGKSAEAVRKELGLHPTGEREELPESPLVGLELPSGWTLIIANRSERFMDEKLLARLSTGAEAVGCFVEEHVMVSQAASWKNGEKIWAVDHDGSDGPGGVHSEGTLPPEFGALVKQLEHAQQTDGEGVDHLFDAPLELAKLLVGFRHDEEVPGFPPDPFEVLAEENRSVWKSFLGRLRS